MNLRRTLKSYADCDPRAISDGSPAQMYHFVADAKHDVAALAADNAILRQQLDAAKKGGPNE